MKRVIKMPALKYKYNNTVWLHEINQQSVSEQIIININGVVNGVMGVNIPNELKRDKTVGSFFKKLDSLLNEIEKQFLKNHADKDYLLYFSKVAELHELVNRFINDKSTPKEFKREFIQSYQRFNENYAVIFLASKKAYEDTKANMDKTQERIDAISSICSRYISDSNRSKSDRLEDGRTEHEELILRMSLTKNVVFNPKHGPNEILNFFAEKWLTWGDREVTGLDLLWASPHQQEITANDLRLLKENRFDHKVTRTSTIKRKEKTPVGRYNLPIFKDIEKADIGFLLTYQDRVDNGYPMKFYPYKLKNNILVFSDEGLPQPKWRISAIKKIAALGKDSSFFLGIDSYAIRRGYLDYFVIIPSD